LGDLTAAALIMVGPILLVISIAMENMKNSLIENGKFATGTFQEWRNSFMSLNGQVILGYLPGSPEFLEDNSIGVNPASTIAKYAMLLLFACGFAVMFLSL
jgi:hypothetical protein